MYILYHNLEKAKDNLNWGVKSKGKKLPSECIKCGACERVCPQHIKIRDNLVKVANTLEK